MPTTHFNFISTMGKIRSFWFDYFHHRNGNIAFSLNVEMLA